MLFFFGDNGYPDFNRVDAQSHQPVPPFCDNGAGCVYARYLAQGSGPELAAGGVDERRRFTSFYWSQQASAAGTVLVLTLGGALGGGLLYGVFRPRAPTGPIGQTGGTSAPDVAATEGGERNRERSREHGNAPARAGASSRSG